MRPRDPDAWTYVDTSVLVAVLAPEEARHPQARRWIARRASQVVTSVVAEVELGRALSRRQAPDALVVAGQRLLAGCELVDVTAQIRSTAVDVQPTAVRSLDALHVATALVAEVGSFASYDARQLLAAEEAGLATVVP